jgi:hypothetical protein
MNNSDMPAMAQQVMIDAYGDIVTASELDKDYMGLTKREHFAGLVMQGLLAEGSWTGQTSAVASVKLADALLKALEVSHE